MRFVLSSNVQKTGLVHTARGVIVNAAVLPEGLLTVKIEFSVEVVIIDLPTI